MRKLPTKIKEMQGTIKKSRENPDEVEFSLCQGVPDAPSHLDEHAQNIWISSAEELHSKMLLYKTDLPQLETYCEASMLKRIAIKRMRSSDDDTSENSKWKNWFKRWKDAAMVMDAYSRKFGFSPVDKTNVAIPMATGTEASLLK